MTYYRDITGWKIEIVGAPGQVFYTYTNEDPGIIKDASVDIDGADCIQAARVSITVDPEWEPYTRGVQFYAYSHGVEISLGELNFVGTSGTYGNYQFVLEPLINIIKDGPYQGVVPPQLPSNEGYPGADCGGFNKGYIENLNYSAPTIAEAWTETNGSVVSKLLENSPQAVWGINSDGLSVIFDPSTGDSPTISLQDLYDVSLQQYDITPYNTGGRVDSGGGWKNFEIIREVPSRVPQRAQAPDAPTFTEIVSPDGPRLLSLSQVRTVPWTAPEPPLAGFPTPTPPPRSSAVTSTWSNNFETIPDEGQGKAICQIWDLQDWYEQSALIDTNQSEYEPLTAYLTIGLRLDRIPPNLYYSEYEVIFESAMWISSSDVVDDNAIGPPTEVTPLVPIVPPPPPPPPTVPPTPPPPPAPVIPVIPPNADGLDPSPIHPRSSAKTITVLQISHRERYYIEDNGKTRVFPFQIPVEYFRQSQVEKLGTRWFLHVATCYTLGVQRVSAIIDPAIKANVTFELYPPKFGKKIITGPTSGPAGINYPFFVGPSWTAKIKGYLKPPHTISGIPDLKNPGSFIGTRPLVGISFSLTNSEITSSLKIGTLPYRRAEKAQTWKK